MGRLEVKSDVSDNIILREVFGHDPFNFYKKRYDFFAVERKTESLYGITSIKLILDNRNGAAK